MKNSSQSMVSLGWRWGLSSLMSFAALALVAYAGADLRPAGWLAAVSMVLPYIYWGLAILALVISFPHLRTSWSVRIPVLGVWLFGAFWWGRYFVAFPAEGPSELNVATWNLGRMGEHRSLTGEIDAETLACVEAAISDRNADIWVFLEVSKRALQILEERIGLSCNHVDYFGTGADGRGGLAVCSQAQSPWSITRAKDLPLPPGWRYIFVEVANDTRVANILGIHFSPFTWSKRSIKRATEELAQGRSQLAENLVDGVEHNAANQAKQLDRVLTVISNFKDPTILAGDFNRTSDAAVHWRLRQDFWDTWLRAGWGFGTTYWLENWLPLRIDFIYADQEAFEVVDANVGADRCSDHRLVKAGLKWAD
ncbi:MAG: endonuclease/exonuclease/phosphatase family protein [Myxococcota bacterium]|nr:endonuclease/exonuclease/phosphatase family protein [Myxococcota bacterium]